MDFNDSRSYLCDYNGQRQYYQKNFSDRVYQHPARQNAVPGDISKYSFGDGWPDLRGKLMLLPRNLRLRIISLLYTANEHVTLKPFSLKKSSRWVGWLLPASSEGTADYSDRRTWLGHSTFPDNIFKMTGPMKRAYIDSMKPENRASFGRGTTSPCHPDAASAVDKSTTYGRLSSLGPGPFTTVDHLMKMQSWYMPGEIIRSPPPSKYLKRTEEPLFI